MKTKRIFLIIMSILGTLLIGAILLAACAPKDKDFKTEQEWTIEAARDGGYQRFLKNIPLDKRYADYMVSGIVSDKLVPCNAYYGKHYFNYAYSFHTAQFFTFDDAEGAEASWGVHHAIIYVKQKPKSFKTKLYNFLQGNKKVQKSELQIEILYVL